MSWSGHRGFTGLVVASFATAADDVPVAAPTDACGAGFGFAVARICPELLLGVEGAWRVWVGAEGMAASCGGGRVVARGALVAAFGTAAGVGASGVGVSGVVSADAGAGIETVFCVFTAVVRDGRRAIPAGGASGEGADGEPAPTAGAT